MKKPIVASSFATVALMLSGCMAGQMLQPGNTFSDPLRSGGRGPEMVVIPAGSFQMGCVSRGCPRRRDRNTAF